ncbi:conserved hypothetical protein [Treponema primitia ZAS-2]|uniref:Transcriptional regulator, AbiEi antitoxin, Type IV TA system n=1 Tax=Treponema primitia (strain ATCC BAA-887 / DSM 12427 / ZAS-2) TaxID=545694 RepID=F5YNQ9_TREPZ|nr:hypothetical protein [Treponema primitia]AEF86565.1 conserved hypothetical protein [Treponema primitia ZAS-2]
MNRLTHAILEQNLPTVFTMADLKRLEPEDNARYCQMRRALALGDIIRLRRGFYALNRIFRKELINGHLLAHQFIPDSYISFETALRDAGWIPEFVFEIASVSSRQSCVISTEFARFSYTRIPQKNLFAGVEKFTHGLAYHWEAKPLKALADYLYVSKHPWNSLDPLVKSLRIEIDDLETLSAEDFNELEGNYEAACVENFLSGIRKELQV